MEQFVRALSNDKKNHLHAKQYKWMIISKIDFWISECSLLVTLWQTKQSLNNKEQLPLYIEWQALFPYLLVWLGLVLLFGLMTYQILWVI